MNMYLTALKRQLVASPFASPVMKQPCTKRLDVLEEDNTTHQYQLFQPPNRNIINVESDSASSIPESLSLADLQTQTYELTSITPTTCTSYFAQFGLDDPNENDMTMDGNGSHPLHSTATSHVISSSTHCWNPPIHSTMVDSQIKFQNLTKTCQHWGNGPIPQVSLPLVGGLSRIHSHLTSSSSNVNGASQSAVADSGVAASGDFNYSVVAPHGSSRVGGEREGESGVATSSSDPALKQAEDCGQTVSEGEKHVRVRVRGSDSLSSAGAKVPLGEECNKNGPSLAGEGGVHLKKKEEFLQGDEDGKDLGVRDVPSSEIDSGLVFSPEHNLEQSEHLQHNIPTTDGVRHLPYPLATAATDGLSQSKPQKFSYPHNHHEKTPSRHSNVTSSKPSTGFVVPISPANLHHHVRGVPGLINNGLGCSCHHHPTFSSRLTSKCAHLYSGVLPSRLKLTSASTAVAGSTSLKSPPYAYLSAVSQAYSNHGSVENHMTLSREGVELTEIGGASRTTPTSRFSGVKGAKNVGSKSSLSCLTSDVIKRKESLKARLKFNSKSILCINNSI